MGIIASLAPLFILAAGLAACYFWFLRCGFTPSGKRHRRNAVRAFICHHPFDPRGPVGKEGSLPATGSEALRRSPALRHVEANV